MWRTILKLTPQRLVEHYRKSLMDNYPRLKHAMLNSDPEIFDAVSEKSALYMFRYCKRNIPAYKRFINRAPYHREPKNIKEFRNVPETNKDNYVFAANSNSELCKNGDIRNVNFWVKSSGHSGKEREWGKSNREIEYSSKSLAVGLDVNFDITNQSTLIINGYILSSWVCGLSFALMAHEKNAIINVGPSEKEILETVEMFDREYRQIIILGYPPFIKHLVDYACSKNFRWDRHNVHFFVGGEYFPEEWREYVEDRINKKDNSRHKIIAGYGSSDLGLVGGIETDESITIRRLCRMNRDLSRDVFGEPRSFPMLFQYPPFIYVHTNKGRELLFTSLLPENPMPLVNYNLKDQGGVISHNRMKAILKKHNINIDIRLKLPFIFIEGRSTGAVKLCAFMIYPENIKEAIFRTKDIAHSTTGRFRMRVEYDKSENESFLIDFELMKGKKSSKELAEMFSSNITKTLREVNQGYDSICRNIPDSSKINIVLHEYGEFPHEHKTKFRYV